MCKCLSLECLYSYGIFKKVKIYILNCYIIAADSYLMYILYMLMLMCISETGSQIMKNNTFNLMTRISV